MPPINGSRKICRNTATETAKVESDLAVTAPSNPKLRTMPFSPTASCASRVRYGPNNAPTMVVEKAEFAQSYMDQPKISRESFLEKSSAGRGSWVMNVRWLWRSKFLQPTG